MREKIHFSEGDFTCPGDWGVLKVLHSFLKLGYKIIKVDSS